MITARQRAQNPAYRPTRPFIASSRIVPLSDPPGPCPSMTPRALNLTFAFKHNT